MKKWYLKLNEDNIIIDIIEYAYEDYVEVEMSENSLPSGINGGWYKLEDGIEGNKIFVEYPELKPKLVEDKSAEIIENQTILEERISMTEDAIMALMDMSMM